MDRCGTTDDFASSSLHLFLLSTALREWVNSSPVHSLIHAGFPPLLLSTSSCAPLSWYLVRCFLRGHCSVGYCHTSYKHDLLFMAQASSKIFIYIRHPFVSLQGPHGGIAPLVGAQGYHRLTLSKPVVGQKITLDAVPAYRASVPT